MDHLLKLNKQLFNNNNLKYFIMQTITINLYSFKELTKEIQDKAIEQNLLINLHDQWYINMYEDAICHGFKIIEFNLDRANFCKIENIDSFQEIAKNINPYNKDLHLIAQNFLSKYEQLESKELYECIEDLENEFKEDLENEYLGFLRNEYDFLMSDQCIKDHLISLGECFNEDGTIF